VKKSNDKWRMCIDITNLNKTCPKDSFPLLWIDLLVDLTLGHELLSVMDSLSGSTRYECMRWTKRRRLQSHAVWVEKCQVNLPTQDVPRINWEKHGGGVLLAGSEGDSKKTWSKDGILLSA
jgi:hypothetical protein